jgi:hypothetical protein
MGPFLAVNVAGDVCRLRWILSGCRYQRLNLGAEKLCRHGPGTSSAARFLLISKDLASAPLCLFQGLGQETPTLQQGLLVRDREAQGRENFVRFRFMTSVWHEVILFPSSAGGTAELHLRFRADESSPQKRPA